MKYTIQEIQETISTRLWIEHPFLAQMMVRLGLEFVESDEPHIGWTDGLKVYINVKEINANPLFENFTMDNMVFLVAHEIMHTITLTSNRRCGRDANLWNVASDYEINQLLLHNRVKNDTKPVGEMPQHPSKVSPLNPNGYVGCYSPKYIGMSAENIYEDLLQIQKNNNNGGSGDDNDGDSLDLGGMGGGDSNDNHNSGNAMSPDGSGQQVLDKHQEEELTPGQQSQLRAEIKSAIKGVEMGGTQCGKGSSSIFDRIFNTLFKEPPFDWRGFLNNYLKSYIKDDYTWKRPNRRSQGCGAYLPGNSVAKTMKIAIAIDTSGSVSQKELSDFFAHINKIMKSFKYFTIDVWCFSGCVHEETHKQYTQSDKDITRQLVASNGTTDISSNFEYLKTLNEKLDCFIVLTDGYDDLRELQYHGCPVIWGIIGNKEFKAPKGVSSSVVMPIEME